MKLSDVECREVYPYLLINGERHFYIANLISEHAEYGNARSHLILGTEELLKAMLLFMDNNEFAIREIEGLNKLFHNHVWKHKILKELFSVLRFPPADNNGYKKSIKCFNMSIKR